MFRYGGWAWGCLILFIGINYVRAEELQPSKTYAVIVGVLEWEHGLQGYPKRNRKDQELRDLLVRRGTPANNLALILDQDATLPKIRAAVSKIAKAAGPGSTLIVYYAGHGMPAGADDYCFANYELNPSKLEQTGWHLQDLGDTLAKDFKGKQVLLCADCCYSGGLEIVVERLAKADIAAANITSAGPANTSTNNWTFTQSLIDALSGAPLVDTNDDGRITLKELAVEVGEAMRHMERQQHGFVSKGLADEFVLAKTRGSRSPAGDVKFPVGSYVQALDDGQQRVGRVVAAEGDDVTVQFYDYSDKRKAVYSSADLAPSTGKVAAPRVVLDAEMKPDCEVEWKGTWYPAKLLKTEKGKHFIHYVGYESSWDEWVEPARYRSIATKP